MTGLKLLADRVDGKLMSRAVAGHAASTNAVDAASDLIRFIWFPHWLVAVLLFC